MRKVSYLLFSFIIYIMNKSVRVRIYDGKNHLVSVLERSDHLMFSAAASATLVFRVVLSEPCISEHSALSSLTCVPSHAWTFLWKLFAMYLGPLSSTCCVTSTAVTLY